MDVTEVKIVFYDGECGFCNRSVAFVLKNDKSESILFASIQSEFSQNLFNEKKWQEPDLSTFYFLENEQLFAKSTAAIKLSKHFSFPQSWLKGMVVVPRFIRDFVYDNVAKRRHRISKGYCFVPSDEQRVRFI
ncbi:MAG TPA: DUF393 domain-containing protein [Crocinitomicaceae bacterium]|nr:DUF393 domain-containing protein [Crocinitomicaceae bacterium]